MGTWGVEATRYTEDGGEIAIKATRGADARIRALMNAVWERIGGGAVILPNDSALDERKTKLYLNVEKLEATQFDRFCEEAMRIIHTITGENEEVNRK